VTSTNKQGKPKIENEIKDQNFIPFDWGSSSVVEHLPSKHKALGNTVLS
jgi:hypothetical protein